MAVHPLLHPGFGLWFAGEPVMKTEESVVQHLKQTNPQPSDLDSILLAHLYCDHAGGLIPLKDTASIYTTKEELNEKNLKNAGYYPNFWKGIYLPFYEMEPAERARLRNPAIFSRTEVPWCISRHPIRQGQLPLR